MDPPKPRLERGKPTGTKKQELKWISLVKKILLDQIPLQTESGYALEDEFMVLNDGPDSFKHLKNSEQEAIIYLLKSYMTSSNIFQEIPITLTDTIPILKNLSVQNEHLRKLFFDPIFCRQLIKLFAQKFNLPEIVVVETMKFGASHEILIQQNQLLNLCMEGGYSEKEFEKQLHAFLKNNNVDINFTYFNLQTLLMNVVKTNHPSFVRPLIKVGADRFMKDHDGNTAKDILNEYWPEAVYTHEMPLEYQIAFKELMRKK
jgi:hypothetical protein